MRYISINSHTIRRGGKLPIRIARSPSDKNPIYASEVRMTGGQLVYNPDKPILKCGAKVTLICQEVEVVAPACRSAWAYKGIYPPRCAKGKGCAACRVKFDQVQDDRRRVA